MIPFQYHSGKGKSLKKVKRLVVIEVQGKGKYSREQGQDCHRWSSEKFQGNETTLQDIIILAIIIIVLWYLILTVGHIVGPCRQRVYGNSVLSAQFCSEPKTALNIVQLKETATYTNIPCSPNSLSFSIFNFFMVFIMLSQTNYDY